MRKLFREVASAMILTCILSPLLGRAFARTWGVPSGVPTIPDAADSATAGDTILVAPGIYECPDNIDYDIYWVELRTGVSLISTDGAANTRIVDRATREPHYLVACRTSSDCLVKGFEFVRDSSVPGSFCAIGLVASTGSLIDSCAFQAFARGVYVYSQPTHWETPLITHSSFEGCGAGVYCSSVQTPFSPQITYCTFLGNSWGVVCYNSAPYIADNSISGSFWAGVYCAGQSSALLDRNTIVNGQRYGLWVETEPYFEPVLTNDWLPANGNSIHGNLIFDLYNNVTDQRGLVEARYTYWGSNCPDFDHAIGGPGRVNYSPWCNETHTQVYVECPPEDDLQPVTWGAIKATYK